MSTDRTPEEQSKPLYHQGTMDGWSVEARIQGNQPGRFEDQIFDACWRRVVFDRTHSGRGIPNPAFTGPILDQCNLHSYEAAQALRWWFHAQIDAGGYSFGCSSLETRLVSHKVTYKVEWMRVGTQDNVGTWPEKS